MKTKEKRKAFNMIRHNTFQLTFPNGNSLSTIWGTGTYSDNYDIRDIDFNKFMGSETVEIMILNAPDKLVKKIHKKFDGDGSVIGYLKMEEWLYIVKMLSK